MSAQGDNARVPEGTDQHADGSEEAVRRQLITPADPSQSMSGLERWRFEGAPGEAWRRLAITCLNAGHPAVVEHAPGDRRVMSVRVPALVRLNRVEQGDGRWWVTVEPSVRKFWFDANRDPGLATQVRSSAGTGNAVWMLQGPDGALQGLFEHQPTGDWTFPLPVAPKLPGRLPLWPESLLDRLRDWWNLFAPISKTRARALFDGLKQQTCSLDRIESPCIPDRYPDNYCWARAHAWARLMQDQGVRVRKLFAYGAFNPRTADSPTCKVDFEWHVAPVVRVRAGILPIGEWWVFDATFMAEPAPVREWIASLKPAANATTRLTDARQFYDPVMGTTEDATGQVTETLLQQARLELLERIRTDGAPPYAHCTL